MNSASPGGGREGAISSETEEATAEPRGRASDLLPKGHRRQRSERTPTAAHPDTVPPRRGEARPQGRAKPARGGKGTL